jgi:cytochrome c oxidase subunit I+III
MWSSDPKPTPAVDIGGGIKLPTYASGPLSHSWWAMVVLLLVAGSLYLAFVFSYLYLWTVSPQVWPKPEALPAALWPVLSAALLVASAGAALAASRAIPSRRGSRMAFVALITFGVGALVAAFAVEVWGHWSNGLRPSNDAHAAMVAMASFLQAQLAVPVVIWACFVVARLFAGHIGRRRRATVENLVLMWLYVVGQGLLGLLLVHGFPRFVT